MNDGGSTRFATFNVHSGRKRGGGTNLRMYRDSLSQLKADVVGLQEVDVWMLRSGRNDLVGEAADQLGAASFFANARRRWDMGMYGNALLVKGKVRSEETVKCHRGHFYWEKRVAQIAQVFVNGVHWNVANTHLSLHPEEQPVQLGQVADALAQKEGPRVLMGDFNMDPAAVASVLEPKGWKILESDFTFPSWEPDHTVDYICLQGAVADNVEVMSLDISDHAALVADLRPE